MHDGLKAVMSRDCRDGRCCPTAPVPISTRPRVRSAAAAFDARRLTCTDVVIDIPSV